MPRENVVLQSFNRGKISSKGLARTDLDRTRLSAEIQTNYVPRILGSMMFRPGTAFIDSTYNNQRAVHIPFIKSLASADIALVELTPNNMRIKLMDDNFMALDLPAVSTSITNGGFNTDLTGWTDADQSGATSAWATGGYMGLTGTRYNKAIRKQTLTVSAPDQNVLHGVTLSVTRGIVNLRIGSTDGGDDLFANTDLAPGTHVLTFTPTSGSVYLELSATTSYQTLLDSISITTSGDIVIPTDWDVNALPLIRFSQSADVIFCACYGIKQKKIERRTARSWSLVDYITEDGPFLADNITSITLTPGAISGDTTLTASQNFFKASNIGSLFKITSVGQQVTSVLSGDGQFTNYIKIIGTGSSRNFTVTRTGTWSGTLTLQRSIGEPGAWANTTTTYTTNASIVVADGLDNQIVYYRIGFDGSDHTSGSVTATLVSDSGGITGIAKVTGFTSDLIVSVSVLEDFGGTGASETWAEGAWSTRRGFPSSVALYEGRLWWAGKDKIWGSVSDAFASYDGEVEGESGPISRSIGEGPVDNINWLLPVQRLAVGGEGTEYSARSSSFDDPLTPDNFNLKSISTQGSHTVAAEKLDNGGIFVQRGGTKVYELVYNLDYYDYATNDLTEIVPEQCASGVIRMDIQRKPDTRLHCVLGDGTVAMLVYDNAEEVKCWIDIVTDGIIEDVVVVPTSRESAPRSEDLVFYVVQRQVDGNTVRYLEQWALEEEAIGGALTKTSDCHVVYNGVSTATITGLSHLEGETVVAWGNSMDLGSYTVSGGAITLSQAVTQAVVGLPYTAQYKSSKLAYAAGGGTALNMIKRVPKLGMILENTHRYGIRFGGDFNHLQDLPSIENGKPVADDYVWGHYDQDLTSFNGDWNTDSRICLQSESPKPATILGVTFTVETNG